MGYLWFFIIGTAVGSFLNVVIERLPRGKQVLLGRSHCDNCGRTLSWTELIPIASFMLLKGRCQNCFSPIPYRYPLIELVTGLLFVFVYWQNLRQAGSVVELLSYLIIVSALMVIFMVDLRERIILDEMLAVLVVVAIVLRSYTWWTLKQAILKQVQYDVLAVLAAGGFFWLIYRLTKGRGMGFGDVKFAAVMGFLLGFPLIIVGLWTAFLSGGFLAVILLLTGKKKFGQTIPFGPFLVLGTMTALFWGEEFIKFLIPNS